MVVGRCGQRTRRNLFSLGNLRDDWGLRLDLGLGVLLCRLGGRDGLSWNVRVRTVHLARHPHLAAFRVERTGRDSGSSLSLGGLGDRGGGGLGRSSLSWSSLGGLLRLLLEGGLELGLQVVESVES